MYRLYFITLLFFSSLFCNAQNQDNPEITPDEIKDHITFLASDDLKGRFTGTPEADKAAEYIAEEFRKYGLEPMVNGSYYQDFPFIASLQMSKDNFLAFADFNNKEDYELSSEQFTPMPFTGKGYAKGKLAFLGYGISAPDLNYDDYENVNVKGKIIIVMRYNPEGNSPMSKFEKYSSLRYKATTAKEKGAAGIIFVNGHSPKNDEDQLTKLTYDGAPGIDYPAVHIKRSVADELFKSYGLNFMELQRDIDSLKQPKSLELSGEAEIETDVRPVEQKGRNVAGILKAKNDNSGEYIIIGAHYDHLGMGITGSLSRSSDPLIHNGADDNASGTTGVLELAEKFASEKDKLKRSIIFITFAGEELGLLGSAYFVKNTPVPISNSALMINLDMIGRLNNDKELIIYGTGTAKDWKDLINKENEKFNFKISMNDDGYGPSDHSSFYGADIPVLFFFTGIHSDYHRPSDDAAAINAEGEESVLNMAYNIAMDVNRRDKKPEFVNVPRKDMGKSTSFRVYVGTVPDFGSNVEGYKVSNVTEGSPAQKGGMKAGDIMIRFGNKKVSNIYDYTYALGEFQPGDTVDVVVLRDGKEVKLKIELSAR